MSKINQVQSAIRELGGGAFQKLMDAYLFKRFEFKNIMPLGSHTGTNKTTKGTPDSYVLSDTGKFILIAYGTVSEEPYTKIEKDVLSCLDEAKTGINIEDIEQIICCHTSTNITPGQYKQIGSHFHNTLLIGMGELSLELSLKYPAIAKDYLSIEIDTHQIFDKSEYIEYTSRNAYSTPLDTPLLCREKEISESITMMDSETVIMICGKSGIGKTRLALEIADLYGASNNYAVKIIKSNNESIYDDLYTTFTDDKDFLIVVDDADQLVQLGHLLDLCVSNHRIHRLKVLMTVRDYAKELLLKKVVAVLRPAIYLLEPLDDNNIKQVLIENLGIKSDIYIQQILQIAKGNIRLAIMAGKCAMKGPFESIKNAFDIFNSYFAEIINGMDQKEIITATLIALFDSLTLKAEVKPVQLALEHGIDFDKFVEICEALHQKEIVSIFNNLAVKFEDQNLRDYLLYYVFFKTKWLTPSYIILCAFPYYRKRIVYAFNTLIGLFETKENLQFIENEIKKAWVEIKTQSDDTVFQFVEAFHAVIPDEALLVIKQQIDRLPEEHTDFSTYDFDKTSNNHTLNSKFIKILTGFKNARCFEESLQIAFYYLERHTEYPMDFYFFFGKELGFERESYKYGFAQERLLIEKLTAYYEEKRTTESALCLTFCITNCLEYHFSVAESNRNNTVTFFQFGLPSCTEVFEIRSLCFKALSVLFSDAGHKKFAIRILLRYSEYLESDADKTILEQDLIAFTTCFANLLDMNNFEHCTIVHHFQTICERHRVSYPEMLLAFKNNRIYMLYLSIKKDRSLLNEDWEEADLKRKQEIYELCPITTDEEFDSLWTALESYDLDQRDQWDVSTGIRLVFDSLANECDHFMTIVNSYIHHETPFGNQFTSITSKLIELLGYDAALEFVGANEFGDKRKWLAHIYDNIPESKIETKMPVYFLEKLVEQKDEDTVYTLSLSTVLNVNSLYPGFIIRYFEAMNEMCEKNTWVISAFMSQLDMRDLLKSSELVNHFKDHLDVLESAYLNALRGRRYFDHNGQLLMQIIERDIGYISTVVKNILADGYHNGDDASLDVLWDQDNYDELVTVAMDAIKENSKSFYDFNSLGERLLSHNQGKTERWSRQESWISDYIIRNNADADSMKFIFGIICNLSEEQKNDSILLFCKYNCTYPDFRMISLLPSHMSWSGSEVPILEKQISFLANLKSELTGFAYVEHRAYLAERIQYIQTDKENALLREFIEAR